MPTCTAFSHDQAHKIYVQHRMKENATAIRTWLQERAHVAEAISYRSPDRKLWRR